MPPVTSKRIVSLDQFRGYHVAAMLLVNFLAGLGAIHLVLVHHNTYFSYADSILPGFLFAVGFSYRLTMLRRLPQLGPRRAALGYLRRALSLVVLSLVLYGFAPGFADWEQMTLPAVRQWFAGLLKAELWEVLAIIGVTQVFILPVVAASARVRLTMLGGCLVGHVLLSYWFNFDFVYGRDNWLNAYWGAADKRAWDGGPFGVVSWSVAMLAGTFAYDVVSSGPPARAVRRLCLRGAVIMIVGYSLSCLTTLYDVPSDIVAGDRLAASPVLPPLERLAGRSPQSLMAEPPLVPPPPPSRRQENYWMMGKRVVSVSYILFASGFAFALYAGFVWACDIGGRAVGLLGTFGRNPLAAYLVHYLVLVSIRPLVPDNAPVWYCLCGLVVFFGLTYLLVRQLDKRRVYVRL